MKLDAHEQPLVFVKDALGGTVHADAISPPAADDFLSPIIIGTNGAASQVVS